MASITDKVLRKFVSMRKEKAAMDGVKKPSYQLNKLENIICEIQRILIWDDPDYSTNCILLVNVLFCLLVFMDFKVYGVIFFLMLCFSLEDMCEDYIAYFIKREGLDTETENLDHSLEFSTGSLTVADVTGYLKKSHMVVKNACDRAKRLRQTEPGLFCVMACLCFLWLNVVGHTVSDVLSFYILLMLLMTVPGVLNHYLPPHVVSSFSNTIYSSRKGDKENDDEVEFYLPETTPENLELLQLAGDLQRPGKDENEESNDLLLERISAPTSGTTESVCSKLSFYPECSLMPSPETSMDFLELGLSSSGHLNGAKLEENASENNDINFQSQHFDGQSSDEDEFVKGLTLNTHDRQNNIKEIKEQSNNVGPSMLSPGNLMSVGKNLINAITTSKKSSNDKESSDTDSFEIISDEDM